MYGERHLQAQPVADQCELEVLIGWTWSLRLGAYTIVGPWSRRVFLGGLLGGLGGHRGAPQREAFWEGFWEAVLKPFGSSPARPFRVSRGGFIGVRVAVFRPRFVVGFRPRFVVGFRHQKSPKTIFFLVTCENAWSKNGHESWSKNGHGSPECERARILG